MPRHSYSAFISYSTRYRDWVDALHAHLEATLELHGESRPVFLDHLELVKGRSWVNQLAAGLDRAAKLVLVVTPEAMASPWVGSEWQALITQRRDWSQGRLIPLMLVWAPLPLFLGPIQYADFRDHDEAGYKAALRDLVGGLLDMRPRRARQLDLPANLTVPEAPKPEPTAARRRELIARLVPVLTDDDRRRALGAALGRDVVSPDEYGGADSAASALIVEVGEREIVAALERI